MFTWRYRPGIFGPRHLPGGDIKMTVMNIGEPGPDLFKVGWCRLTVSKPVLKAPMVAALETMI